MQQEQVVKVFGTRFGSGYLIAPRIVLTAAHLLATDAVPEVSLPPSATRFPAAVRWHGGETLDVALLEVTAEDWSPPTTLQGYRGRRPQRWGWCVTAGTPIPISATGFPRQQRDDDGVRDPEPLNGSVRPRAQGILEILDAHSPFGPTDSTSTPWLGMSGAAAFPAGDELLLGVVKDDRQPRHGTRLTATRVEDMLARDDFRAVVRAATGVDPRLEPVELAELLKPAPPSEVYSPSMLLRGDAEVVSFHGREDELAELEQWCLADGPPSVRVLTGPGGQGKTRLARQLMARLRDRGERWVTGEVRSEPADLNKLRTVQHPLLLVVDYAESRPELVRKLRDQIERASHPARLLLLARSLGSWGTKATGNLREIRLHALSPGAADRDHVFRLGARDLARRLADGIGRSDVDWPRLAETLPVTRLGAGAETALTVQMAALVALLRQAPDTDERPPEAELLDVHESKYWMETAEGRRIRDVDAGLLAKAVAVAVLCPALDEDEAVATLARLMPREPLVADVAAWLCDLYPPPERRYWGQLEPDRLGEYLAAEKVIDDPQMLTRLFAEAPDHQRVQTLTVLARAAVAHANEKRADKAHTVVDRLRAVLRAAPAHAPLTATMLRAHSDALPAHSHLLRDYALDVARELSQLYGATGDNPRAFRDRAWALHNLAERHLAVGDWGEAVTAAGHAATIRGRLAGDANTMAQRTEWADSLLVLSRALRMTGRLTEAHQAGEQALDLFRALAAEGGEDWEKRERGLVRALINQAQVVWQLDPETISFDQIARSDDHTDEALARSRDLVGRYPDLDPTLLTDALAQRSTNLWYLQRGLEALAPSEEAVRTARQLANENPDAYAADLADALMGLAVDYKAAARPRGEAMALEQEAIDLLRPLAADLPEVYLPNLARTLSNLAWDQFDDGAHDDARATIEEAIEHRRALARRPHGTRVSELARSLSALASFHADTGDHRTAVGCFEEALELYASAKLPLSAADLKTQSGTTLELAQSYEALGRTTDALTAVTKAGVIRRRLSAYAPSLYMEGYASALLDLADLYRKQDRPIPERIVLRHALPLYRKLASTGEEGRAELAFCLYKLGASYASRWPTAQRAVTVLREAYDLRVELSAMDARHEVDLADTCTQLARALLLTSRFPEAVRIAGHEVYLGRRLLIRDREGEEWPFCLAQLRQAEALTMAGNKAEAWRTALEAEQNCRALIDRPARPPADIAFLLGRLARTLSLCGRHDVRREVRALEPARRAARIYRRLVGRNPAEHQANLNGAVSTLAGVLTRLGRHAEAADARLRRGA